jgi:hypothetical protein
MISVTVGGCPEGDDRGEELGPGSRRSDRQLCPDERRSPTRRYSFGFRIGNTFPIKNVLIEMSFKQVIHFLKKIL